MNKRIIVLSLLMLVLSGCTKKKTTETVIEKPAIELKDDKKEVATQQEATPAETKKEETKPIFDDEIEGFVLEEEGANAFTPPAEETEEEAINIIEQDELDDSWIDKRLEQAQEYGLKTIYFDFDKHGIRPDQRSILEYDIKRVKDLTGKNLTVVIEGHACKFAGSALYNMMLSEKRASAIADYLAEKGIARDHLKVVGRGYELCIVPEGDMEQQSPNRRVEFYVLEDVKK
jgi:outer membrane protein OmpA-like peptidoglycan-associated protein